MSQNTRDQILNTAEKLFANNGFAATSLRSIVSLADVNLAAVNYHFGSKEGLIEAVLERRITPLNRERIALLEALETDYSDTSIPVEKILESLVAPALRLSRNINDGGEVFTRLLGRAYVEPDEDWQRRMEALFGETATRFMGALKKSVPSIPQAEFFWRIHFCIGAMAHTMCDPFRVHILSKEVCSPDNLDQLVSQLVTFLSAGMNASPAN